MHKFKLAEKFLDNYRGKQPKWGPLGRVTYARTYSRTKPDGTNEEFWETVKRVVEGCYAIQKEHCRHLGVEWNNEKAQYSAMEMYRRIWDFKFLPPGRGLWLMGSDDLERHSGGLLNCGVVSTSNLVTDLAEPFCWAMEMLMLGVGIGYDSTGAGTIKIQTPKQGTEVFVVPDSREGWVDALRAVITPFSGKGSLPSKFDYSKVRPAGEPIKGFGGIASGPGPLIDLLEKVKSILTERIGDGITLTDINDIFNLVGKCVVSGNVRRSALLSLGPVDDQEFLNLKNPETNMERLMDRGWVSNNSVSAKVGDDYTDIAKGICKNGEPGIIWLDNCRKYGRFIDGVNNKDYRVVNTNPCFRGDTLIAVADGRNAVSIKQLAEEGSDVPVYSLDPITEKVEIKWGRHPRLTGQKQKLVRIHFREGGRLDVTPNHKILTRDGRTLEAKDLVKGDRLPRFTKSLQKVTTKDKNAKEYYRVVTDLNDTKHGVCFEHRLISKFYKPEEWESKHSLNKQNGWIKGGLVVHHKDYDPLNNRPENLEVMTFRDHSTYHAQNDCQGEKNGMYGKSHSEHTKSLIGTKSSERFKDPEYIKKHSESIKAGVTTKTRELISTARKAEWSKYYNDLEGSGLLNGLETFKKDGTLFVKKHCEHCSTPFEVPYRSRERAFCSLSCSNANLNARDTYISQKRFSNLRNKVAEKQLETMQYQIAIFKNLQESLGRDPMQSEFFAECKNSNIPFRFRGGEKTCSPYTIKNFSDLKEKASEFNHCVDRVEILAEEEDVYNITVDNHHTVGIVVLKEGERGVSGVFTPQCGEQPLEGSECCCLVEVFPAKHENYADYEKTLKFAYLYAKTVTLVKTHSPRTNAVMQRNRRIGTSNSGIVQAIEKFGKRKFFSMCDSGYAYIKKLDEQYSEWFCVTKSIKTTTVKPSGTTSLLCGATPGVHFPHSEYYIRRIRFSEDSSMVPTLKAHGYKVEQDSYSPGTVCVEFPVKEEYFSRSKTDVSMWEQLELAANMQYYWSDNSVSITVTVKPEEMKDVKQALEFYETRLKSVSFLPLEDHKYVQPPYETITKEQYEEMVSKVTPITSFGNTKTHELTEVFCTNDVCEIKVK